MPTSAQETAPLPSFASRVLSVTPRPPHQGRRVWTRALPFLTPPQPPSHPGWLAAQELPGSRSGARAGWGSGLRLQAGVSDETRGWVGSCLGVQGSRPGGRPAGNATHRASGPSVTRRGRGGQEGGPPGSRLSQRLNPGLRGSLLLLPKPGDSRSPAACPTPDQQPGGLGATGVTLGAMLLPAAPPGDTLPGPGVAFLTERQPHTKAQWAGGRWPGRARSSGKNVAVLFPKAGPRVPPGRGHQSRQTASSCWPGFHVGASLGEGPPRGWAARVTGPHSGPPRPAQVQPFPGQAAPGRAETPRRGRGDLLGGSHRGVTGVGELRGTQRP